MAKVGKNIKSLRINKNLTQEDLAKEISVTRQTISSWETNRTQPDIEMIELLSAFFNTDVEELIYGQKRKVGLEPDYKKDRKIFSVILATLGSLFIASGLIILFVELWANFTVSIKTAFSFLPLIFGGLSAFYVISKKSNSLPWREAASVLWSFGMLATTFLVGSLHSFDNIDFLLILNAILIVPIIYILRSSFPLLVYFSLITIFFMKKASLIQFDPYYLLDYTFYGSGLNAYSKFFALNCLFLAFGYFIMFFNKKKLNPFNVWIGIIVAAIHLPLLLTIFNTAYQITFIILIPSFLIALYAYDNNERQAYPFRYISIFGIIFYATMQTIYSLNTRGRGFPTSLDSEDIPAFILSFILIIFSVYIGRNNIKAKPLKAAFIALTAAFIVSLAFEGYYILFLTIALDFVVVLTGIKTIKLMTANLGLVSICIIFLTIILGSDFEMAVKGLACLVIGVSFIVVNYFINKFFESKKGNKEAVLNA